MVNRFNKGQGTQGPMASSTMTVVTCTGGMAGQKADLVFALIDQPCPKYSDQQRSDQSGIWHCWSGSRAALGALSWL